MAFAGGKGLLNGLDLFSGIGGIAIALSDWVRPIAYCEIDKYCQAVLLSRIATNELKPAPIWDDIRSFNGSGIKGNVDIIYGGFPCQDISVAGLGKGLAGERSALFWQIHRLAKEILPKFIFLENVPAITSRGGLTVVRAITEMGYDCRWCVISAASVGALHRRERWFLLGNSKYPRSHESKIWRSNGEESIPRGSCKPKGPTKKEIRESERAGCTPSNVADTECERLERRNYSGKKEESESRNSHTSLADSTIEKRWRLCSREAQGQSSTRICGKYATIDEWQEAVSTVCRVTDGIPQRVERLRGLGNAVVPMQAKEAFKILMGVV